MRVAIYVRVSTTDGRQDTTNQLDALKSFCSYQDGWVIEKIYRDTATGKHGDRQAFQQLLADASMRKFDVVLFWALDRFSREGVLPTLKYLERLTALGVGYRSYTEQYLDSCGIFKDVVISLLATMAKQERIRLSERTKAGLARQRASGKPGPNGYMHGGRPALDQYLVAKARKMREAGETFQAIADALSISKSSAQRLAQPERLLRKKA